MLKYLISFAITIILAVLLYFYLAEKNRTNNPQFRINRSVDNFPPLNLNDYVELDQVIYKKSDLENNLFTSLNGYIKAITPDSNGKIVEEEVIQYMSPEFVTQLQNREDMKKGIKDFSYFNALIDSKLGKYKIYQENGSYLVDINLALIYQAKAAFYILDRDIHQILVKSHIYAFSLNQGETWFFAHPSDFTMNYLKKNFPDSVKKLPDNTSYRYIKKANPVILKKDFDSIKNNLKKEELNAFNTSYRLNTNENEYRLDPSLDEKDIQKLEMTLKNHNLFFNWLPYSKK